ncbi:MAG TPA: 30S ribosomal protein S2, partial [Planctomycetota bacterium]|nr:30S ribosomal protein S2 [Planctomycetota bacterium]
QIPGALVVIDIRREHNAVLEAKKVGIPVVALVDTDCDPRLVDIPIPGNDDAYRSIQVILHALADAVILGRKKYETAQAEARRAEEEQRAREEAEAARRREAEAAAQAERAAQAAAAAESAASASSAEPASPAPEAASSAPSEASSDESAS